MRLTKLTVPTIRCLIRGFDRLDGLKTVTHHRELDIALSLRCAGDQPFQVPDRRDLTEGRRLVLTLDPLGDMHETEVIRLRDGQLSCPTR